MATARRMGPSTSATSNALLDAAERVLRNEGYGAASSRRIGRMVSSVEKIETPTGTTLSVLSPEYLVNTSPSVSSR